MRYTEIVVYRKVEITDKDTECPVVVRAYRVSTGHGFKSVVELPMADLYRGHTAWIREDIDERNRVRMERNSVRRAA